jgi:hypothetical protein
VLCRPVPDGPPAAASSRLLVGLHSDHPGGLNGSTQHLLKAFLSEPWTLISYAELNSNKSPV